MNSSTVFYHAISNGYDKPAPMKDLCAHTEYQLIVGAMEKDNAAIWNRRYKILAPPDHGTLSCYMDGNIAPKVPACIIHQWVEALLHEADIAICKHAARKCAYVEIEACVGRKKITEKQADAALAVLDEHKMPRNFGLWECGIILRRHGIPWVRELQKLWFNLMQSSGVYRDQIWLPLALHLFSSKIPPKAFGTISMDVRKNDLFTFGKHR